ncbi:MAG: hypothetical protein NTX07_09545 [Solirubrobacterales bacterium]|nr:hypothetical protein [Solirubrobacterales bacterium]
MASAAAPEPCGGTAQIDDASGDGHHIPEDVLAAWFAESGDSVSAVIQVRQAVWEPQHDDSDVAGYSMLYSFGGQTHYVRAQAPRPPDSILYDYGTWTRVGGFISAGTTTGIAVEGYHGTVTVNIPAAAGVTRGTKLGSPFVLVYDGIVSGEPHWVDRAPGGVTPDDGLERGADFVVGSCSVEPPVVTSAVVLKAPTRITGKANVTLTGTVVPARAGVAVALTVQGRASRVVQLTTGADGSFRSVVAVSETTRFRAVAETIASQTRTLTVYSTVRISIRKIRAGIWQADGIVNPALPGSALLLRTNAYRPTATGKVLNGRFSIRLKNPTRGSYEAVYIPIGTTAERSTSNIGALR